MTRASICVIALVACVTIARADTKEARRTVEQACRMCHAAEMLSQQRLTLPQWEKTVTKMLKWGAQMEPEEPAGVIAYLAGPEGPAAHSAPDTMMVKADAAARFAPQPGADAGDAVRGASAYAKFCASCHGVDGRGKLSPSIAGRPVLARPAEFREVVLKGRRRMPSYENVIAEEDIRGILTWVRKTSRAAIEPAP